MAIDHHLAVIPVSDLDVASTWYEQLLGRAPDDRPMENLAEWRVTRTGQLQVFVDVERAGFALVNLAVDDMATHLGGVRSSGLSPQPVQAASKGVELSSLSDPGGNAITFIGNLRPDYQASGPKRQKVPKLPATCGRRPLLTRRQRSAGHKRDAGLTRPLQSLPKPASVCCGGVLERPEDSRSLRRGRASRRTHRRGTRVRRPESHS